MDKIKIARELKVGEGDYSIAITAGSFYNIQIKQASNSQRDPFSYKIDMTKETFISLIIPILDELGYSVQEKQK